MAHINIFANDAFRAMELSEAVREIPNQWGRIGELGLFASKGIRGTIFSVESYGGVLQLVNSSTRGTSLPGAARGKRKLRNFQTERFGLKSRITADDVDQIRAFGSETEMKQVATEIAERQMELRSSVDVTREYLRAGALQGKVLDADGTTIIDLHAEYGIIRKAVDFVLGTATTDVGAKVEEVVDHIRISLVGDVMTSVHALVGATFWDKLMGQTDFRDRFKYFENSRGANPDRENVSRGFEWKGVIWEKYLAEAGVPQEDGSTVTQKFMPATEVQFFPNGTRQTFRQFNGSADYMGFVNQPGSDFYSAVFPDRQEDRFADVEVMMQTLPMCLRPAVLVRGWTSN